MPKQFDNWVVLIYRIPSQPSRLRLQVWRKLQRMGEAVSIGNAGPLQAVAEALDPDPSVSRMTELRTMAQAVEAGRAE